MGQPFLAIISTSTQEISKRNWRIVMKFADHIYTPPRIDPFHFAFFVLCPLCTQDYLIIVLITTGSNRSNQLYFCIQSLSHRMVKLKLFLHFFFK